MSVVSALTPEMASRSDFVQGVLPPGLPGAARLVVLSFGLALVWISRGLARRKRRAWLLAVGLVVTIAAAHLAKGFDFEEATASVVLLAALVRYRGHFDAPGDPAGTRALALAAGGCLLLLAAHQWIALPGPSDDLVTIGAALLAVRALYLWLRPVGQRVGQTVAERSLALQLVTAYGRDSLSFFTLRRDKNYFFAANGRAFLAYRVVAGAALVSGDPVGDEREFAPLLERFHAHVHGRGWRLAVLGAGEALLPLYRSLGLRTLKIGDEAVVRPGAFSLEGRPIRKVRQSVSRLERAGYRARVLTAADADGALRAEVEDVSTDWLGHWPERGFGMAMDDLFTGSGAMLVVAEDAEGHVGGFIHLVPAPASGGYSLSAMRRRRETPNGLMEFLIAETIAWARAAGACELSLNFCVFANLLRPDCGGPARRALGFGLRRLDRVFQLDRLLSFTRKFFPEWRPRFLCFERPVDFPLVGLAYLHLESLLTPPGPWVRRA
jgi:lysyl-tRNA synthetase class 2